MSSLMHGRQRDRRADAGAETVVQHHRRSHQVQRGRRDAPE